MQALICKEYGSADQLILQERDEPKAGPGEVVVDIRAAGVNFPDLLSIAGKYQVKTPPPFVPGVEAAGVVREIGEGVTGIVEGQRVIVTPPGGGAFAQACAVDARYVLPLPDGLDFRQGAGFTITYATTAHAFLQSASLQAGESVLVLGAAGGVGSSAIEIAKAMGAQVIAAASNAEKTAFARELGADEVVNYGEEPLKDRVKAITSGRGVDVVYDPVGGDLAQQALKSLAWQGRYLVIGFACGDIPAFPANIALLKEASIIGVWWGTWAARDPDQARENMLQLARWVDSGQLAPRVTEVYPLKRFKEAFACLSERRAKGKVVLEMADARG